MDNTQLNKAKEHLGEVIERLLEAQTASGSMYIRHLVLTNGGALAATIGARAVMASEAMDVGWASWSMLFFALGLITALFLNGFVYVRYLYQSKELVRWRQVESGSEYASQEVRFDRNENCYIRIEIMLGVFGFVFLIFGFGSGIRAFY